MTGNWVGRRPQSSRTPLDPGENGGTLTGVAGRGDPFSRRRTSYLSTDAQVEQLKHFGQVIQGESIRKLGGLILALSEDPQTTKA
jgi:hypothetical protein